MKNLFFTLPILLLLSLSLFSQNKTEQLDSIVISGNRIDLPFSKNSRTISIITKNDIKNTPATNLNELLQEIAGIDIRQRGVNGTQADLYIRGGNFEQTLLLIDGIKVEDPQTGHHTLNTTIPLESIERIEIIKGPASRVYGQNAFSGAINIVTKKNVNNQIKLRSELGSFNYLNGSVFAGKTYKKSNHIFQYTQNKSDGYRENTDFNNTSYFLKSAFKTKLPFTVLATFSERKFGANNFYTFNPNYNEYEETQTSLVAVSSKTKKKNWIIKSNIFWKRNQDIFLLKRENPDFSRNFNISNKIGLSINNSYYSKYGITGIGIEIAKTTLSSNNLGNQNRNSIQTFLEHRFRFANNKLDITPGLSYNYFSDFGNSFFPGIDFGYQINASLKYYWNIGKSYRVPSYTELYINIPNFLQGNPNLKPEEATAQEMGIKYHKNNLNLNFAVFNRVSKNLIDYIKETNTSPFYIAKNLRQITTNGFEINTDFRYKCAKFPQKISLGYTFLQDDYKDLNVFQSRYLINTSIKHHITATWQTQFFKYFKQTLSYKYIERPFNKYQLLDAKITATYKNAEIYGVFNNLFNTKYFEKIHVPMPERNWLIGISYVFK